MSDPAFRKRFGEAAKTKVQAIMMAWMYRDTERIGRAMKKKLLVLIPAYNEEESICRTVEGLRPYLQEGWDYIVVNDGSRDNTAKICREHGYHLLDLPVNLGLTGAFLTGMKYALQEGYDCVVQFDGDGQHRPEYLVPMMNQLEDEELDIVIGSRFVSEVKPQSLRMLGSNLIALAIRLSSGKRISDPTSGMRMFAHGMIEQFCNNYNYGPEPDTIAFLIRCGAKVGECQVHMNERSAGTSYLNLSRSIYYMINMMISILMVQFFRNRH